MTTITRKIGSSLSTAVGLALGGLPSLILGFAKKRTIDFNPRKRRGEVPFSSTRQDRRTAHKVYSRKMLNGRVVMQTLPAWARRNEVEVDAVLGGSLKLQTVDA